MGDPVKVVEVVRRTVWRQTSHSIGQPGGGALAQEQPARDNVTMKEIELKFQVPEASWMVLQDELSALPGGQWPLQTLEAIYFDTPDRRLARARAALRIRREDDDWVQTLKAAGANPMVRLEDNQPCPAPAAGQTASPDLSRHHGHARDALVRDLGWDPVTDPAGVGTGLTALYGTAMQRQRAQLAVTVPGQPPAFGTVELALDQGEIRAGTLQRAVRELEIELIEGDPRAVLVVARDLVVRHGVWLDVQTKAHRGDQLAREASSGRPSPMPPARPRARQAAWTAGLQAAVDQISHNASEVAQSTTSAGAELSPWAHSWVSGLRRARMLWRHAPSAVRAHAAHGQVSAGLDALTASLQGTASLTAGQLRALARSQAHTLLLLALLDTLVQPG